MVKVWVIIQCQKYFFRPKTWSFIDRVRLKTPQKTSSNLTLHFYTMNRGVLLLGSTELPVCGIVFVNPLHDYPTSPIVVNIK